MKRFEITGKIDGTNVTYGFAEDAAAAEQMMQDAKASAFFTDAKLIDRESPEGDEPEPADEPAQAKTPKKRGR